VNHLQKIEVSSMHVPPSLPAALFLLLSGMYSSLRFAGVSAAEGCEMQKVENHWCRFLASFDVQILQCVLFPLNIAGTDACYSSEKLFLSGDKLCQI